MPDWFAALYFVVAVVVVAWSVARGLVPTLNRLVRCNLLRRHRWADFPVLGIYRCTRCPAATLHPPRTTIREETSR